MKFISIIAAGLALVIAVGCKQEDDILKQQEAAKKMPPPSAAQMKKGFEQIAANHEQERQDSANWAAKRSPEELAKVNAARAQAGKPPLGQ